MPEQQSIELKLTSAEWLMVRQLTTIEPEIAERVANPLSKQEEIPFTIGELGTLAQQVRTELYQTGDDRDWDCLEQIHEKISLLLEAYTNE